MGRDYITEYRVFLNVYVLDRLSVINIGGDTHTQKGNTMSELALDISNAFYKLVSKIEAGFDAFMESKFMKAYEEAAKRRAQYYMMRSTINELHRLSDAELRDIGIARGEIYDLARQTHIGETK